MDLACSSSKQSGFELPLLTGLSSTLRFLLPIAFLLRFNHQPKIRNFSNRLNPLLANHLLRDKAIIALSRHVYLHVEPHDDVAVTTCNSI